MCGPSSYAPLWCSNGGMVSVRNAASSAATMRSSTIECGGGAPRGRTVEPSMPAFDEPDAARPALTLCGLNLRVGLQAAEIPATAEDAIDPRDQRDAPRAHRRIRIQH